MKTVRLNGQSVDYAACVELMCDELRDYLHREMAPCSAQEFVDAYCDLHEAVYGEEFVVN